MEKSHEKDSPPVPLYYRIKTDIRSKIEKGRYPAGSMIPGEFRLMEAYGVSRATVIKAVTDLANEGYLVRRHGKGTFASIPAPPFSPDEMVGIAMKTSGHLYEGFSSRIINGLMRQKYFCLAVDVSRKNINIMKLRALVEKKPAFLLVDGFSSFPFGILDEYKGRIIFINRFESENEYTADYILADYLNGGREVAEHFISIGRERIIYIGSPGKEERTGAMLRRGMEGVLKAHGMPRKNLRTGLNKNDERGIFSVISELEKPLAVFCESDAAAGFVYSAARELGLSIPGDIAVAGYYDTPWCRAFYPQLTSVSIREREIADLAVDRIADAGGMRRKTMLKPHVVARGSTVGSR